MEVYMSFPYVSAAGSDSGCNSDDNIPLFEYYHNIYNTLFDIYSQERKLETCTQNLPRLRSCSSRENFIAPVFSQLLSNWSDLKNDIDVLYDCSSTALVNGPSSVYRIAKKQGLIYVTPIALGGTGGTEFAQGLKLFMGDERKENASFILSQIVNSPDEREKPDGYMRGDAASAVMVSKNRKNGQFVFRVLKVDIIQTSGSGEEQRIAVEKMIQAAPKPIKWLIADRVSKEIFQRTTQSPEEIKVLDRKSYPNIDFGCADVFITLNEIFSNDIKKIRGCGFLCLMGQYGNVSGIVVETVLTV